MLTNPFLAYELFALLAAIPLFVLFRRAGLKPWPVALVFVPLVGFCLAASALAFPRWPVLPERVTVISEKKARILLDAEAERRGWAEFSRRRYELQIKEGRTIWVCNGLHARVRTGVKVIRIDAVTGEVIDASVGGK